MPTPSNPAYTSPTYTGSPITGDRLKALDPGSVRKIWKKGFDTFETQHDFFAEMEGKNALSIIQTETDTAKGAGQEITFTVASELYGEPHLGDALFNDSRHFEELLMSSNTLKVDWFRHGIRHTQRSEEVMGMRGEIASFLSELQGGIPNRLGGWAGRLKTEMLFMMFLNRAPGENVINLGSTLTWDSIVQQTQMMKRFGATGAIVARDPRGKPVRSYVVVACTDALTSLELDSDYRDILRTTRDETGAKYIFSGGYTPVRGHIIKEYEAIEHDGYGAIGSPLNPMGRLANAITGSTTIKNNTALRIIGGGSDYDANNILVKPTKYFPQYAYAFLEDDVLSPDGITKFHVAIVNPPNAPTDPGKYGFYECLTNDGVGITVTKALVDGTNITAGSGVGGGPDTATTVGNLTWDGTKHTNTHPVDALFVLVDPSGKALFNSLVLSAACARRGYGKFRGDRFVDTKEAGFIREVYFWTVFGQSLRKNRRGALPGALVLQHTGQYAGLPLPS